jgi:hypothetical protein
VSGPLSKLVDGPFSNSGNGAMVASEQQSGWHSRFPNLRTVVLEILSDRELVNDEECDMHEDNIYFMLKEGAQASGITFWKEVYVDDLSLVPPVDTLGLV